MLLRDILADLARYNPTIHNTLTIAQFVTFATLSADFLKRTQGAYATTPLQGPIDLLTTSLDPLQPSTTWARLWYLTHDSLPSCHYDHNLVHDHGIPHHGRSPLAMTIPERTFHPPTNHCYDCHIDDHSARSSVPSTPQKFNRLEMRTEVYAYLFELSGISTVQYFSGYCRSEISFLYSLLNYSMIAYG